ncbi:hypothetical protein HJG60_009788 [Phyllostomus discolor]|uniref:Uncharacterized protein n=1 Tax=Phyllostomus discolor TaxID=89673 RepID=A0A834EQ94_9CHIR|nr:hypothetical protein HJG60_009788 [Phyllostomus discolor]
MTPSYMILLQCFTEDFQEKEYFCPLSLTCMPPLGRELRSLSERGLCPNPWHVFCTSTPSVKEREGDKCAVLTGPPALSSNSTLPQFTSPEQKVKSGGQESLEAASTQVDLGPHHSWLCLSYLTLRNVDPEQGQAAILMALDLWVTIHFMAVTSATSNFVVIVVVQMKKKLSSVLMQMIHNLCLELSMKGLIFVCPTPTWSLHVYFLYSKSLVVSASFTLSLT